MTEEAKTDAPRPDHWCELKQGRLSLATVFADGSARNVSMNLEPFPEDHKQASQWIEAVSANLAIAARSLFAEQLHDAAARDLAEILANAQRAA